jgi:RES domain-containing protein
LIPGVSEIRQDDTHRLIPSARSDESVLARLAENESDLEDLIELDGATNDRLLGEANHLPGISVHELLFGVAHAGIVNAAFTHAHPAGGRFNGPERGAWYSAFELKTAQAEVAFHKSEELREINWNEPEDFAFDDYLADFRADFHDLRGGAEYGAILSKDGYTDSQQSAARLLAAGSAGIVYPSVRQNRGTCLVCFRPALVTNVRQGLKWTLAFRSGGHKAGAGAGIGRSRLSWSPLERPL